MPTIRERFLLRIVAHTILKNRMPDIPLRKQGLYYRLYIFGSSVSIKAVGVHANVPGIYPRVSGPPSPMLLGTIYPPENYINF